MKINGKEVKNYGVVSTSYTIDSPQIENSYTWTREAFLPIVYDQLATVSTLTITAFVEGSTPDEMSKNISNLTALLSATPHRGQASKETSITFDDMSGQFRGMLSSRSVDRRSLLLSKVTFEVLGYRIETQRLRDVGQFTLGAGEARTFNLNIAGNQDAASYIDLFVDDNPTSLTLTIENIEDNKQVAYNDIELNPPTTGHIIINTLTGNVTPTEAYKSYTLPTFYAGYNQLTIQNTGDESATLELELEVYGRWL